MLNLNPHSKQKVADSCQVIGQLDPHGRYFIARFPLLPQFQMLDSQPDSI